jgi:hypothetical protein
MLISTSCRSVTATPGHIRNAARGCRLPPPSGWHAWDGTIIFLRPGPLPRAQHHTVDPVPVIDHGNAHRPFLQGPHRDLGALTKTR